MALSGRIKISIIQSLQFVQAFHSQTPHIMAAPYANDHLNPNGPNDARPTALKIIRDEDLDGKLIGKVFLITGCTSGVGVEIARAIHATGADVYITGRQSDKGKEVVNRILADGKPGKVVYLEMSLDSLASVKEAAANFLELSKTLNVLICNAGKPAQTNLLNIELNNIYRYCPRTPRHHTRWA